MVLPEAGPGPPEGHPLRSAMWGSGRGTGCRCWPGRSILCRCCCLPTAGSSCRAPSPGWRWRVNSSGPRCHQRCRFLNAVLDSQNCPTVTTGRQRWGNRPFGATPSSLAVATPSRKLFSFHSCSAPAPILDRQRPRLVLQRQRIRRTQSQLPIGECKWRWPLVNTLCHRLVPRSLLFHQLVDGDFDCLVSSLFVQVGTNFRPIPLLDEPRQHTQQSPGQRHQHGNIHASQIVSMELVRPRPCPGLIPRWDRRDRNELFWRNVGHSQHRRCRVGIAIAMDHIYCRWSSGLRHQGNNCFSNPTSVGTDPSPLHVRPSSAVDLLGGIKHASLLVEAIELLGTRIDRGGSGSTGVPCAVF
mmetsp:Transcript_15347/g.38847  ORF Transcript_15347/g.38847 Transcript_15347/m.38847 type:complete len:356 (-) Transcript_15347:488-1555(-)